jgi:endonuclease G
MNPYYLLFFFILNLFSNRALAQDGNEYKYLPKSILNAVEVKHSYYAYSYDQSRKITSWVAYNLSKSESEGNAERSDSFFSDPKFTGSQAGPSDYYRSGYDRGHLAPAGDMSFSQRAMDESFYMTNVVPQNPTLNRGLWSSLESDIRDQVKNDQDLFIVTGTLFIEGKGTINGIHVPDYLYKIVFDYQEPEVKMIAFLIPNEKPTKTLMEYAIDVDRLEAFTNLDFFSELEDGLESRLESSIETEGWFNPEDQNKLKVSVQCKGIAVSTGNRCRHKTYNVNGYCHQHQSQVGGNKPIVKPSTSTNRKPSATSGRCAAKTKAGTRCKRSSAKGSRFCWQHG